MIRSAEHIQWDAALAVGRARADLAAIHIKLAVFARDFQAALRNVSRSMAQVNAVMRRNAEAFGQDVAGAQRLLERLGAAAREEDSSC